MLLVRLPQAIDNDEEELLNYREAVASSDYARGKRKSEGDASERSCCRRRHPLDALWFRYERRKLREAGLST